MTGPLRERLAVVQCGGRQGSGYLLTPWLVLTSAHVVRDQDVVRVTVPDGAFGEECTPVGTWYEPERGIDVALVASEPALTARSMFGRDRWAQVTSHDPIRRCVAVGFPLVQRAPADRLDTEQLIGTYKPASGMVSGRGVLVIDGTPPAARTDGTSPWAGLSGAAVFAGEALLGVVTGDPLGWQHGRVTVVPVHRLMTDPDFLDTVKQYGHRLATPVSAPDRLADADAEFEDRYRDHVGTRHGRLRIFGIDLSDKRRATWALDTAYYSLEMTTDALRERPGEGGPDRLPVIPVPTEQALAGHERILLRGVAGSGKTTLVQWLAVTTARQDLGEELRELHGLVPFVLPLRTIARRDRLPAPADFLSAVNAMVVPSPGWAERVLRDRRGLVLVDGLDEIDERARDRVRDWLRELLAAYPGNRWLVTSRPTAVEDAWLSEDGFTELTLTPMSRRDVRAFVGRWHEAARATVEDDPEEIACLDRYERQLLNALTTKQDLARLATNPLMCGLICALQRDRNGYLPSGRKELYDAALSMLLIRRDRERDLETRLSEAPQIQLLQKLAYWLVKNGQAEMDVSDAVALIGAALPSMPAVAGGLGDAHSVFRYLLERSGLLRSPTVGTVDFIHRTFQDYLAARAAVEDRDFPLMVNNAHHDQWADVIRMAVAHGRPDERAQLLRKIIARGDRRKKLRTRLHLLAMACLEHATELDASVRAEIEQRVAKLIPPRGSEEIEKLIDAGPIVLELLPGPEQLADRDIEGVFDVARSIGGDAGVAYFSRFTDRTLDIALQMAVFPVSADPETYVTDVLAQLPREEMQFFAQDPDELTALSRLSGLRVLQLYTAELADRPDFVSLFPCLRELILSAGGSLDVAPLVALGDLEEIRVYENVSLVHADALPSGVRITRR